MPPQHPQAPQGSTQVAPTKRLGGNILLVVLDDIGIEALTSYGEGQQPAPTPNLDKLAAEGVLFRYAYGNPLCSPTRATIQTGRYAFRTGIGHLVKNGTWALQTNEVTLPKMLAKAKSGYRRAAFGKWHLGNQANGHTRAPNIAGWPHFAGVLHNVGYFTWPRVIDGVLQWTTGYITSDDVDNATNWIAKKNDPWLCYVAFTTAHLPYHAPPSHLHSFTLPNAEPAPGEDPRPYFHAMVEAMDTELGRLLQAVDLNETTVIVVGDNGSEAQVVTQPFNASQNKATVYEGGTRVPLIVRSPHVVSPGREVTAMVNTTDMFDTVAELAGVDLSTLALPKRDSVSIVPYLIRRNQRPLRDYSFSEKFKPAGPGPHTLVHRAIRDNRYKLISFDSQPNELYDLLFDPYEATPLNLSALRPREAAAYADLQAALAALLAS
jgi:arylsulfatase A-like enzyme